MTADDDDRAEDEMLDRLDAGLPAASPEEQAARAPYERLLARVRDRPLTKAPEGASERLRDAVLAAHASARSAADLARRRQRIRRMLAGAAAALAAAAAAAILLLVLLRGDGRSTTDLYTFAATPPSGTLRAEDGYVVGGTITIDAKRARAHTEVRLYSGTKVVARCPGDGARCSVGDRLRLEYVFENHGNHRILWIASDREIPPPGPTDIDADIEDLREIGADLDKSDPFTVQP